MCMRVVIDMVRDEMTRIKASAEKEISEICILLLLSHPDYSGCCENID